MSPCTKTPYPDKKAAATARNLRTRGRRRNRHNRPSALRIYYCPDCHHWHLTKRP